MFKSYPQRWDLFPAYSDIATMFNGMTDHVLFLEIFVYDGIVTD
jgi:hypothetical protein